MEKVFIKGVNVVVMPGERSGEFGYDLEYYMYHNRFGPTNVTLEKYLAKLFPDKSTKKKSDEKRMLTKFE